MAIKSPLETLSRDFLPILQEMSPEHPDAQEILGATRQCAIDTYAIAKEKQCFQTLTAIKCFRTFLDLQKFLESLGVQFYLTNIQNREFTYIAQLPPPPPKATWPILRILCQFQRLMRLKKDSLDHPEARKLLHICFETADRHPEYKDFLSIIPNYLKLAELEKQLRPILNAISCPISYWKFNAFTKTSSEIVQRVILADTDFGKLRKTVVIPTVSSIDEAETEAAHTTSKKTHFLYAHLVHKIETEIEKFNTEALPTLSLSYAQNYSFLTRIAQMCNKDLPSIISSVIQKHHPFRVIPDTTSDQALPSWLKETLLGFDIQTFPTAEEFQRPLIDHPQTFFVDKCQERYEQQKLALRIQPIRLSDFLPDYLVKQQQLPPFKPSIKQTSQRPIQRKCEEQTTLELAPLREKEKLHLIEEPPQSSSATANPLFQQSTETASSLTKKSSDTHLLPKHVDELLLQKSEKQLSSQITDLPPEKTEKVPFKKTDSAPFHEKSVGESAKKACPEDQLSSAAPPAAGSSSAKAKELPRVEETALPVRAGDRQDLDFLYTDHVSRWANRDVFTMDDDYKTKKYSESAQEDIRLCHLPPLAVIPVVVKLGQKFLPEKGRGNSRQIRFSLPGEIIQDNGKYDKGVLTVSRNKTGEFTHVFFTKKTPIALMQEYAKLGYFMSDEQEAAVETKKQQRRKGALQATKLSYDGSFVQEASLDYVSVRSDTLRVTVNLFPFPELF